MSAPPKNGSARGLGGRRVDQISGLPAERSTFRRALIALLTWCSIVFAWARP